MLGSPVQHAELSMFNVFEDVINVLVIVALTPAQHTCQVIARAQWKDGHVGRVLGQREGRESQATYRCTRTTSNVPDCYRVSRDIPDKLTTWL